MTDLDKAREWAESLAAGPATDRAQAAARLIQSLPDQWVDAEKLREVVSKYEGNRYISEIVQDFADLLHVPTLPTLADMTAEEREACKWMQCKVETDDGDTIGVIRRVWSKRVFIIFQSGRNLSAECRRVTPLPDLPKLEWPGGVVDCEIVEEQEHVDAPPAEKAALPKPEDVPADELWLVEVDGLKAIGTRYKGDAHESWAVAALYGSFAYDYHDSEVTLIHKLVPEPPALPEGMRLADHEEYGRVVVSPKVDTDGEYMIFFPRYNYGENGSDYEYAHKSELTFLDGEA